MTRQFFSALPLPNITFLQSLVEEDDFSDVSSYGTLSFGCWADDSVAQHRKVTPAVMNVTKAERQKRILIP